MEISSSSSIIPPISDVIVYLLYQLHLNGTIKIEAMHLFLCWLLWNIVLWISGMSAFVL